MITNQPEINQFYQAYLIRFTWIANRQQWQTTLKEIQSGREHHFRDAQLALKFLNQCVETPSPPDTPVDFDPSPSQLP